MFWKLNENRWEKIDSIYPRAVHVVAVIVLDLPTFDRGPVVECWGTISYKIDETQLQMPVPSIQLTTAETIDISCIKLLDENQHSAILALKSTSNTERTVNVLFSREDEDGSRSEKEQLFHFLATKSFSKVYSDVFLVKEHGSLMYCLVEVQSIGDNHASLRIFTRSVNQLNIVLHLLRDEFPNVSVVEEVDSCVEAAMALIRELEMVRDKKSALEIQEAKVITDLLIP
ncbi:hypothetical protein DMN91_001578 [Ooceraea biroi]|nr:hypothetical protein X777_07057 [Ooceraea biroi]RLU25422.1 hypothetical protein DMN91_001578 [Ooceraea biroi]